MIATYLTDLQYLKLTAITILQYINPNKILQ